MRRSDSGRGEFAVLATLAPRAVRAAWTGGIALAVGLAATTVWALSTTRLYQSESVILFEHGVQAGTLGREGESPRALAARMQDMMTSHSRLESLIKDMGLYKKVLDKKGMADAVEEMRKHLKISNREGYTYRVSYDGESRDLAKSVLERLTASVIDEDAKRRTQEAEDTKRFLDTERKQADDDLKVKEGALTSFLTKHPQLAVESGAAATAGGVIRADDRARMAAGGGGDVAGLELQAAQLEESLAAAGGTRVVAGRVEPVGDPTLVAAYTRAQAEAQAARADLAEKQTHLTNEHPDMKQAQRRLAAAEATEKRAAAALAAWHPPTRNEPSATPVVEDGSGRTAALRRALAAVRSQIAAMKSRSAPRVEPARPANMLVEIDTEWTRLNRDVSEARERQSQLEAKQFQAQLAATLISAGQGGQLVVADPPFRPMKPIAGGRSKIAMVGGAGSVMLGLVVVMIVAMFDDRLYGSHDVESVLPDGIVVVIPKVAPQLPPMEPEPAAAAQAQAQPPAQAQAKEG
jgi:succinoglycan biosynthesis transport protein ExoP